MLWFLLFKENKWYYFVCCWLPDCVTITKTNMEKFGKEMIGHCGGLPLAITILGGLLATKQTHKEWEDVLRHIKSYLHVEQNFQVNKVLALSYYDLPCHLKPCFLYLGHFQIGRASCRERV